MPFYKLMSRVSRRKQAKLLRQVRKIHRYTGIFLFVFFFVIAITGFLLGWKQNFNGALLPKTQKGTTNNLKQWLHLDSLHTNAQNYLKNTISKDISVDVDRIDVRRNKGIAKFSFKEHYYEIQVDGATGNLLSVGYRNSDLIENLHDGSIKSEFLKQNTINLSLCIP